MNGWRINWTIVTVVLGLIANGLLVAYSYGQVSQQVHDVDKRVTRMETRLDILNDWLMRFGR